MSAGVPGPDAQVQLRKDRVLLPSVFSAEASVGCVCMGWDFMAVKGWTSELPWGCPKIKLNGTSSVGGPLIRGLLLTF